MVILANRNTHKKKEHQCIFIFHGVNRNNIIVDEGIYNNVNYLHSFENLRLHILEHWEQT